MKWLEQNSPEFKILVHNIYIIVLNYHVKGKKEADTITKKNQTTSGLFL